MYAWTIDTGATIAELRAFGPPEVVALDDFAGDGSVELAVSKFWTVVKSVSLELVAGVGVADRLPRLTWRALEQLPFAQALAPFPLQASDTGQVTFADVQQAGAVGAPTIIAPMPEYVLLPGWTLTVDVVNGAAADAISGVRCYQQRYELIVVDELIED
jgi:hypothetical protein